MLSSVPLFSSSSLSILVGVGDEHAVLLLCVEEFKALWACSGKRRGEQMRGRFRLLVGLAQPPVKCEQKPSIRATQHNITSSERVPKIYLEMKPHVGFSNCLCKILLDDSGTKFLLLHCEAEISTVSSGSMNTLPRILQELQAASSIREGWKPLALFRCLSRKISTR